MENMKKDNVLCAVAIIVGAGVWIAISAISGRKEAWDANMYYSVGIPVLCLCVGALGFVEPARNWRWAVLPMAGQAVWVLLSQGFGNLMPLGLVVFAFLSLPLVLFARIGAAIGRRRTDSST
jgi:hypothetical protein